MKWLWKVERKFDKFAIHNLMMYVVTINFAVFLIDYLILPGFTSYLVFSPYLFLQGQIWRIVTFVFIPPSAGVIFILFALYFYYMIGTSLENEWGTTKFNLYYFIGIIGTIIASFLTGSYATATYVNLSLFLAFAQFFPDFQVLIFFILPVKMKYLAYINWAFFAYTIIFGNISLKVFAIVSLLNFFLFFYQDFIGGIKLKRQVYKNRKNFNNQIRQFKRRR
ncbi:MAG: rhomboid family intramembrane serine protease [Eubacteriaceae bacterium]